MSRRQGFSLECKHSKASNVKSGDMKDRLKSEKRLQASHYLQKIRSNLHTAVTDIARHFLQQYT
jgi:hypothetical protein